MGTIATISHGAASVALTDKGYLAATMHSPVTVAGWETHERSWLTFRQDVKGQATDFTVFLPPTVAQAMKDAFDKAMAELSKEDAA